MSEMLGNQYFMARNYSAAQQQLEEVILKDPLNKSAKKKLIVCYTQTGKVKEAIQFFNDLISEDIVFVINTNPIDDDCPCPELVEKIEGQKLANSDSADYHLILGIIWLFCDINKSIGYFIKAKEIAPGDKNIDFAVNVISDYLARHTLHVDPSH
jgi:pentatricopeptide repeat protein